MAAGTCHSGQGAERAELNGRAALQQQGPDRGGQHARRHHDRGRAQDRTFAQKGQDRHAEQGPDRMGDRAAENEAAGQDERVFCQSQAVAGKESRIGDQAHGPGFRAERMDQQALPEARQADLALRLDAEGNDPPGEVGHIGHAEDFEDNHQRPAAGHGLTQSVTDAHVEKDGADLRGHDHREGRPVTGGRADGHEGQVAGTGRSGHYGDEKGESGQGRCVRHGMMTIGTIWILYRDT